MNKSLIFCITMLFIVIDVISNQNGIEFSNAVKSSGLNQIFYVDNDFNENTTGWDQIRFNNIQDAINKATFGTVIYVWEGVYFENLLVKKDGITIRGNGSASREDAIINGKGQSDVIKIVGNYSTIQYLSITNSGILDTGIIIRAESTNINNCHIYGNYNGIMIMEGKKWNNITFCDINDNSNIGIYLIDSCNQNEIWMCTIKNNHQGVDVLGSFSIRIRGNTIEDNDVGIILQDKVTKECTISGNTIRYNGWGILLWCAGRNSIHENNFINNYKDRSAEEYKDRGDHAVLWGCTYLQNWHRNYWSPRRFVRAENPLPYPIFGLSIFWGQIPVLGLPINFDGRPSTSKYPVTP